MAPGPQFEITLPSGAVWTLQEFAAEYSRTRNLSLGQHQLVTRVLQLGLLNRPLPHPRETIAEILDGIFGNEQCVGW